ncbi:MAG: hypothetical protein QXD98_01380 [Candidatus Diapherotrites archaeon]
MVSVHFTRPPTLKVLQELKRKGITELRLPKSSFDRLSKKAKSFLESNGINISIDSSRGRPLSLNIKKIFEVVELHRDDRTFREIEEILGVPKSTAHYLVKYAKRRKLKRGNKIVYLG